MQKVSKSRARWRRNAFFYIGALLVVIADQFTKDWIRSYREGESIFELGFFRLTRVSNTGAAFGLFQGQSIALTIIALVGVGVLLLYAFLFYRRSPIWNNKPSMIALGLILGGTVGNLIDRLRFGYVTDFIDFGFWPAFNVADSAITVGVIIFAYYCLRYLRQTSRREDEQGISFCR